MTIPRLVIVTLTLFVISSTVFATQEDIEKNSSNLTNRERLGNSTQNSRTLDSNTPNDEALGISNSNNQNPPSNFSNRPGQQVPAPSNQK